MRRILEGPEYADLLPSPTEIALCHAKKEFDRHYDVMLVSVRAGLSYGYTTPPDAFEHALWVGYWGGVQTGLGVGIPYMEADRRHGEPTKPWYAAWDKGHADASRFLRHLRDQDRDSLGLCQGCGEIVTQNPCPSCERQS